MEPWLPVPKKIILQIIADAGRAKYTESLAFLSLQLDLDNGARVSESGYEKNWGWSRKRVHNFIKNCGLEIVRESSARQSLGRLTQCENIERTKKEHTKVNIFNNLEGEKNNKQQQGQQWAQEGHKKGTRRAHTSDSDFSMLERQEHKKGTRREQEGSTTINTNTETYIAAAAAPEFSEISEYAEMRIEKNQNRGIEIKNPGAYKKSIIAAYEQTGLGADEIAELAAWKNGDHGDHGYDYDTRNQQRTRTRARRSESALEIALRLANSFDPTPTPPQPEFDV